MTQKPQIFFANSPWLYLQAHILNTCSKSLTMSLCQEKVTQYDLKLLLEAM